MDLVWHWPFSVACARNWQREQARQLSFIPPQIAPQIIAGADCGLIDKGRQVRAAMTLFDAQSLEPLMAVITCCDNQMPYIPGLLAFREMPALLKAWSLLPIKPDLLLVDGQGIAHPQRFGIAAHLGLTLRCPTFGVAKSRLLGEHTPIAESALAYQPLMAQQQQLGVVLRSKVRCKPLYLSPGYATDSAYCLTMTLACLDGYRLPKPTRYADILASKRANATQIAQQFRLGVLQDD